MAYCYILVGGQTVELEAEEMCELLGAGRDHDPTIKHPDRYAVGGCELEYLNSMKSKIEKLWNGLPDSY